MTTTIILYLALGAAAGGFVNGLAGTGSALFSLGFYLLVLSPVTAVAVVCVLAILGGIPGLWLVRADIMANKSKLMQFLLPGLVGVPVGVALLDSINAETLRIGIALLLVIYGGYFSFCVRSTSGDVAVYAPLEQGANPCSASTVQCGNSVSYSNFVVFKGSI